MGTAKGNRTALRAYVGGVAALSAVLLTHSIATEGFSRKPLIWAALIILFWVGEVLGIGYYVGRTRIQVGVGESILILMLMELSYSQVLLGIPISAVLLMLSRRVKGPIKYLFNSSMYVVAAAAAWGVWTILGESSAGVTGRNALAAVLAIVVYSMISALFLAVIVFLTEASTFKVALVTDSPATLFNIAVNVFFGLLFTTAYSGARWSVFLFPAPLILMHFGYRALVRQNQERARVEQLRAAVRALTDEAELSPAVLGFLRAVGDAVSAGEARAVVKLDDGIACWGIRDGEVVADMDPVATGPIGELWDGIVARGHIDPRDPVLSKWKVEGAPHRTGTLVAPLTSGEETFGCLLVTDRVGADEFGGLDQQLLEALAEQLALALVSRRHQRNLEGRLAHAQRLEALGRLAGGVAHEFNNLLSISQNYVRFVEEELEESDPRRADLREALAAGERAHALTKQLLTFSRQEQTDPEIFCLNDVAEVAEKLLRRTIGEDIKVSVDLASDLSTVKMDRGQAEQVLMNLAVNARGAMRNGGELKIRTANVPAPNLPGPNESNGTEYVALSVADTGHGMSEEVRRRIFEPFFTTKPKGQGTGLGLAIVYGIVKQAGGDIVVNSAPGEGAEFVVYLPVCVEEAAAREEDGQDADSHRGRAHIMIVEDETGVREVARRILQGHGYEAVVARSGPEALTLLRRGPRPDLLLTDVVMPEMSGKQLVDQVRRIDPTIKAIFMSGYPDDQLGEPGSLTDEFFLQKPFSAKELLSLVAECVKTAV